MLKIYITGMAVLILIGLLVRWTLTLLGHVP